MPKSNANNIQITRDSFLLLLLPPPPFIDTLLLIPRTQKRRKLEPFVAGCVAVAGMQN
jgi:hypothetical protein